MPCLQSPNEFDPADHVGNRSIQSQSQVQGLQCCGTDAVRSSAGKLGISLRNDSAVGYLGNRYPASGAPGAGSAAKLSAEHQTPPLTAANAAIARREDGSEWVLGVGAHGEVRRRTLTVANAIAGQLSCSHWI